jgi:lysozyme family protein
MAVFLHAATYSLFDKDRRFKVHLKVGQYLSERTVQYPRRRPSSSQINFLLILKHSNGVEAWAQSSYEEHVKKDQVSLGY